MISALELRAAYWARERSVTIALGFPDPGPGPQLKCLQRRPLSRRGQQRIFVDHEAEAVMTFEGVQKLQDEFSQLMDWDLDKEELS